MAREIGDERHSSRQGKTVCQSPDEGIRGRILDIMIPQERRARSSKEYGEYLEMVWEYMQRPGGATAERRLKELDTAVQLLELRHDERHPIQTHLKSLKQTSKQGNVPHNNRVHVTQQPLASASSPNSSDTPVLLSQQYPAADQPNPVEAEHGSVIPFTPSSIRGSRGGSAALANPIKANLRVRRRRQSLAIQTRSRPTISKTLQRPGRNERSKKRQDEKKGALERQRTGKKRATQCFNCTKAQAAQEKDGKARGNPDFPPQECMVAHGGDDYGTCARCKDQGVGCGDHF